MAYVRQEIEREIEEGFDPGLQESRGRAYRALRKQNRANGPEVQARREAYEKGDMERPETRPVPMTEGSQRWRRMKELEKETLKKQEDLLKEREEMQLKEKERLNDFQQKLQEVQEMQKKQQDWLKRMEETEGLRQSQNSSSKPAEKTVCGKKALLKPNPEKLRLEKKPEQTNKKAEEAEEEYSYVYEEEPEEESSSSSEGIDPCVGKVDFSEL